MDKGLPGWPGFGCIQLPWKGAFSRWYVTISLGEQPLPSWELCNLCSSFPAGTPHIFTFFFFARCFPLLFWSISLYFFFLGFSFLWPLAEAASPDCGGSWKKWFEDTDKHAKKAVETSEAPRGTGGSGAGSSGSGGRFCAKKTQRNGDLLR